MLLLQEINMAFDQERTGTWFAYGLEGSNPSDAGSAPRFADRLAARFPKIAATIEEEDFGVASLEVEALKQATRNAIHRQDWPAVSEHLAFVDEVLQIPDPELHEAIGISYLTNLFYGETSQDFAMARTLLPKRLASALEIMERHYDELR
jgi:hypothetical protein